MASYGHVSDLPSKNIGIDIDKKFEPTYEISQDKKKVIADLKKTAKSVDKVRIATDEDREGEAIGWHVCNALWLDVATTARIVFHEITKPAITHAIQNPRLINKDLVDAQQARRILDRLVWYEMSPVLWKKVKTWLSAWRVQSVAVRVLVDREREIIEFAHDSFYKSVATFLLDNKVELEAKYKKDFKKESDIQSFLERCQASSFVIDSIETKPGKKSSSAPFTTSTLQQEASRKIWLGVGRTMQLAQKLYEAGHITYMRTDSVNISETAIQWAKEQVLAQYGQEYSKPTTYSGKSKWAQEAHECIRPTNFWVLDAWADAQQKRLYQLIWKRTVASQMADALLEKTKVTITWSQLKDVFLAEWEVIKFDWFLRVYTEGNDNEDEETSGLLPPMKQWETLDYKTIISTETFKKHPPRYTEASLVKKLEEMWIWRPSTYAPTISTIQKRWYVVKESRDGDSADIQQFVLDKNHGIQTLTLQKIVWAEKNKLFPTDIGIVVTDFLVENFTDILDFNFTASVEEQFDTIADGELSWQKMLQDFYGPFHAEIEKTIGEAERASGERQLWTDPKTWKPVIARIWRYGPIVQIWDAEDENKTFASITSPLSLQTITLEQALPLFQLPRDLWNWQEKPLVVSIGRFGPYVKRWSIFASIKKDSWLDPYTVTYDEALVVMQEKIESDKNKYINTFDHEWNTIEVLNWRRWPYIKYNKKNFKIPKDKEASTLTKQQCIDLIWDAINIPTKKATTTTKKKTTKKATAKKKVAKKAMTKKA